MNEDIHSDNYRFLYLTSVPPFPVKTGGRLRSNLMYRALRRLGTVDLVVYGNTPIPQAEYADLKKDFGLIVELLGGSIAKRWKGSWPFRFNRGLAKMITYNFAPRGVLYSAFPDVREKLQEIVGNRTYDAIVVRYLIPAAQCGVAELRIPCFVDLDDFDLDYYRTRESAKQTGLIERLILNAHVRNLERCVPRILNDLPNIWLSNAANLSHPLLSRGTALPNAILPPAKIPEHTQLPIVSFVGSFHWVPNVKAVEHFLARIWPALVSTVPGAQFVIAGPSLGSKRARRWGSVRGVSVLGYVPNIADVYRRSLFTVAPLTMGSGTSIKSVESLLFARVCVATRLGARGLDPNPALIVVESTDQFIGICCRLLRNPVETAALGLEGSSPASRRHSFGRFAAIVENSITRALNRPACQTS